MISELLYIRDLNKEVNDLEANSRDLIQSASTRVNKLVAKLQSVSNIVLETFEEGLITGKASGAILRDGKLRLDEEQRNANITSVKILEVLPSESVRNKTKVNITGDPNVLGNRGLGSDTVWVTADVPQKSKLKFNYNTETLEVHGIIIKIEVEIEYPITPSAFTVKASDNIRVLRIEGNGTVFNSSNGSPLEDITPSTMSYLDDVSIPTGQSAFSKFIFLINVPYPSSEVEGKVVYTVGLHNIKISPIVSTGIVSGSFTTVPFKMKNESLLKVKAYIKESLLGRSFASYSLCFYINNLKQEIPILPSKTQRVYAEVTSNVSGIFTLPFPIITGASGDSITVWSFEGAELDADLIIDNDNRVDVEIVDLAKFTTLLFDYDTFPYTSYTGDTDIPETWSSQDEIPSIQRTPPYSFVDRTLAVDEGAFFGAYLNVVHHDKANGYIFPLDKIPHINVGKTDPLEPSPDETFDWYVNGVSIDVEDITPYDDPFQLIDYSDDKIQFHYRDGALHTNFHVLETAAYGPTYTFNVIDTVVVKYPVKADSVSLKIQLYGDNPLIDMYRLELLGPKIGLDSVSHSQQSSTSFDSTVDLAVEQGENSIINNSTQTTTGGY